jgi:hypothetical protein
MVMKNEPFDLETARKICAQHQYLVGQPFELSNIIYSRIEAVVVSPYSILDKWLFAEIYDMEKDADKALSIYKKDSYDVIVISYIKNSEITFKDLRTYLKLFNIPFVMPTKQAEG